MFNLLTRNYHFFKQQNYQRITFLMHCRSRITSTQDIYKENAININITYVPAFYNLQGQIEVLKKYFKHEFYLKGMHVIILERC